MPGRRAGSPQHDSLLPRMANLTLACLEDLPPAPAPSSGCAGRTTGCSRPSQTTSSPLTSSTSATSAMSRPLAQSARVRLLNCQGLPLCLQIAEGAVQFVGDAALLHHQVAAHVGDLGHMLDEDRAGGHAGAAGGAGPERLVHDHPAGQRHPQLGRGLRRGDARPGGLGGSGLRGGGTRRRQARRSAHAVAGRGSASWARAACRSARPGRRPGSARTRCRCRGRGCPSGACPRSCSPRPALRSRSSFSSSGISSICPFGRRS